MEAEIWMDIPLTRSLPELFSCFIKWINGRTYLTYLSVRIGLAFLLFWKRSRNALLLHGYQNEYRSSLFKISAKCCMPKILVSKILRELSRLSLTQSRFWNKRFPFTRNNIFIYYYWYPTNHICIQDALTLKCWSSFRTIVLYIFSSEVLLNYEHLARKIAKLA